MRIIIHSFVFTDIKIMEAETNNDWFEAYYRLALANFCVYIDLIFTTFLSGSHNSYTAHERSKVWNENHIPNSPRKWPFRSNAYSELIFPELSKNMKQYYIFCFLTMLNNWHTYLILDYRWVIFALPFFILHIFFTILCMLQSNHLLKSFLPQY